METKLGRAPTIFFGHGSPMNALGGPYAPAWAELGRRAAKPRAILMISAHWQAEGSAVTIEDRPQTIHDFGGFPAELFAVQYPAPGAPWLAERVTQLLAPTPVEQASDWGLDHGTWSVLIHSFPLADIPIVQLRLDYRLSGTQHYELGRRLAPLRDEGVMIAGSGDVVHNLRAAKWHGGEPHVWASTFNKRVRQAIATGDHASLLAFAPTDEEAHLSIPTDEHWTPLLYVLGAAAADETPEFFNDQIDMGSVSMLGVGFGVAS
ncbi:MAG: ygiD [Caulobacteraceae bacterium]|nr:ygiD [Caulobacteraceae bacterium]